MSISHPQSHKHYIYMHAYSRHMHTRSWLFRYSNCYWVSWHLLVIWTGFSGVTKSKVCPLFFQSFFSLFLVWFSVWNGAFLYATFPQAHYIAEDDRELLRLLPPPSKCGTIRQAGIDFPPCLLCLIATLGQQFICVTWFTLFLRENPGVKWLIPYTHAERMMVLLLCRTCILF